MLWAQKVDRELAYTSDFINWQHFGYLNPYFFDFREIENSVFIYTNDELYCFGDSTMTGNLSQLPTENIKSRTITSISKFHNDMIITTTNGIFYQDYATAMSKKILISKNKILGLEN